MGCYVSAHPRVGNFAVLMEVKQIKPGQQYLVAVTYRNYCIGLDCTFSEPVTKYTVAPSMLEGLQKAVNIVAKRYGRDLYLSDKLFEFFAVGVFEAVQNYLCENKEPGLLTRLIAGWNRDLLKQGAPYAWMYGRELSEDMFTELKSCFVWS